MKNMSDSMQSTSKFHCLHWKISCQSLHQINNRNNNKKCEQTTQNDSERETGSARRRKQFKFLFNFLSFDFESFLFVCSFDRYFLRMCVLHVWRTSVHCVCVCVSQSNQISANIEFCTTNKTGEKNIFVVEHFEFWVFCVVVIAYHHRIDWIDWIKQWKRKNERESNWKSNQRFLFESDLGVLCLREGLCVLWAFALVVRWCNSLSMEQMYSTGASNELFNWPRNWSHFPK